MNNKEKMELIQKRSIAEVDYYNCKERREHAEAIKNTQIDWKEINEQRENEGLPPIKNETGRKAFVTLCVEDYKHDEHCALVELNRLNMLYENREFIDYPPKEEVPSDSIIVNEDDLEDIKVEFSWLCGKINNQELGESDAIQDSICKISKFLHMED